MRFFNQKVRKLWTWEKLENMMKKKNIFIFLKAFFAKMRGAKYAAVSRPPCSFQLSNWPVRIFLSLFVKKFLIVSTTVFNLVPNNEGTCTLYGQWRNIKKQWNKQRVFYLTFQKRSPIYISSLNLRQIQKLRCPFSEDEVDVIKVIRKRWIWKLQLVSSSNR